ncbi:MAG: hypothetical protein K1X39_14680 [Thermoflexales bacterium]|nr:hypothetical protein [Thermoflexales bacterium]
MQYDETERASSSAARSSAALTAFGRRIVSVPSFSIGVNVRHPHRASNRPMPRQRPALRVNGRDRPWSRGVRDSLSMRTSSIGRVFWGLTAGMVMGSNGCTTQRPTVSEACPQPDESADNAPGSDLSRAGETRTALALQISQGSLDNGGGMTWFAGPPDATTLYVHNLPVCNEATLQGLAKYIDGPRGFRATGFVRVSCYPETVFAFDVPAAGDVVRIEQPGRGDGWFCAIVDRNIDAGFCLRDPGRCRALATGVRGAEPTCEARNKAYCSSLNGTVNCFTSAEACVHLSDEGSTPCDVEY